MRRSLLFGGVLVVAGVAISLAAGSSSAPAGRWVVRDLGTLGGESSKAVALNERGQVVGQADTARGNGHAFLWQSGRIRDLGAVDGTMSEATDVNERGQVVGGVFAECGGIRWHAFLWQDGRMRDLGAPDLGVVDGDNNQSAEAYAINDRGEVIGDAWSQGCTYDGNFGDFTRAFSWSSGRFTLLPLDGEEISSASALSESGAIVGGLLVDTVRWVAVLWEENVLTRLGPAGGKSYANDVNAKGQMVGTEGGAAVMWDRGRTVRLGSFRHAEALAVNDRGDVVGYSGTEAAPRAFLWRAGRTTSLGAPTGVRFSTAVAVNSRTQVIGYGFRSIVDYEPVGSQAFVWERGKLVPLPNLPGGKTSSATAINDHGRIVGWATTRTGNRHAVLWTRTA